MSELSQWCAVLPARHRAGHAGSCRLSQAATGGKRRQQVAAAGGEGVGAARRTATAAAGQAARGHNEGSRKGILRQDRTSIIRSSVMELFRVTGRSAAGHHGATETTEVGLPRVSFMHDILSMNRLSIPLRGFYVCDSKVKIGEGEIWVISASRYVLNIGHEGFWKTGITYYVLGCIFF